MHSLKAVNAALMFFLELAMLGSFGSYGFTVGKAGIARWVLGLGVPLVVIALWWYFAAPRSAHRLAGVTLVLFRLSLFELAALASYRAGAAKLAAGFAVVALVNQVLALGWRQ